MASLVRLEIDESRNAVRITWNDGHESRFNVKWLRFHCKCVICQPEFSGRNPVDRSKFGNNLHITSVNTEDKSLKVTIDKEIVENHVISLPLDWLKSACNCDACIKGDIARRDFKFHDAKITQMPTVQYLDILSSKGKFDCLSKFMDMGFCVIRNVPKENRIVSKIAGMFAHVRKTLFKEITDVRFKPDAFAASATSLDLTYHQDLPYYECTPGVQLLHALEFDVKIQGGESRLVDLFHCAEILRKESAEDFEAYCRIPATFEIRDDKNLGWFEYVRPHIEVDYFGKIVAVRWCPLVEGPLRASDEDVDAYYKAYARFQGIMEREEMEFKFRLMPGDLLMANNHRMAHSRKGYDAKEGERHLQRCYVCLDDLKSTYMGLAHKLGKEVSPPKIGNGSSF